MTQEIKPNDLITPQEASYREHVPSARSRRVVQGPLSIPKHPTANRTADPVQLVLSGASVSFVLTPRKGYRMISNSGFCYRMSQGASAALVTDIYVPANTAVHVYSDNYDTLSAIASTGAPGGFIQLVLAN